MNNVEPNSTSPQLPNDPFDSAPAVRDEVVAPAPAETPAKKQPAKAPSTKVKGSIAGGTWVALIFGFLFLIALLIFILQNDEQVAIEFLTWKSTLPVGVGFLFAAIGGALVMALVGGWRMLELRRQLKRSKKALADAI